MKNRKEKIEKSKKILLDNLAKINLTVEGSSNTVISGNNNSVIQNITPIVRLKNIVAPTEKHISNEQQFEIKSKIDKIVKKDITAGMSSQKAYSAAWAMFKNKFKVTSYKELEKERFDEAIKYLDKINAIKLPKIRRKNNSMWRNELYKSIYAKSNELELSKDDLYNIVYQKYNKKIGSLKELGEQNLTKLKSYLFSIK